VALGALVWFAAGVVDTSLLYANSGDVYEEARKALDGRQYQRALDLYREAERLQGDRADGAVYWQAYTYYKQAREVTALETIERLEAAYPDSRWLDDARSLRAEITRKLSPEDDLKLIALEAIIHEDPERALPALERLLEGDNPPAMKERVLFLLVQSGHPRATEITVEFAQDGSDPEMQRIAVRNLGFIGGGSSDQLLAEVYSNSDDVEVKSEILHGLMISGATDQILAVAREEESSELRQEAIHQLGVMGAIAELEELYRKESTPQIREALLQSFMIAGRSDLVLKAAREDASPEIRVQAVQLLGLMGAVEELDSVYGSESSPDVKEAILHSFMIAGDKQRVLAAASGEPSRELRGTAIHLLGVMDAKIELWALYGEESSLELKHELLSAMYVSGDMVHLIEVARTDPNPELRHEAIRGVGIVGGSRAAEVLEELYDGATESGTRGAVIDALAFQGNVQALIRITKSESDPELKRSAVRHLSAMDSDEARNYLLQLIEE
jgi:HEAT repeat protein